MALNTPVPGLRALYQKRHDVAKVSLVVQPGDELMVSDAVAVQLVASGNFADSSPIVIEGGDEPVADADAEPVKKSRKG